MARIRYRVPKKIGKKILSAASLFSPVQPAKEAAKFGKRAIRKFKSILAGGAYGREQEKRIMKTEEGKKILREVKRRGIYNLFKKYIRGK